MASFGFTARPQARGLRFRMLPVSTDTPQGSALMHPARPRRWAPSAAASPLRQASPPFPLQRVAVRRASLVVRAAQVSSNDFKNGMTIEMDGAPYKVVGALRGPGLRGVARAVIGKPQACPLVPVCCRPRSV